MFWDNVACVYDLFADVINRRANQRLCSVVENMIGENDNVLECACGTGLLSGVIAKKCRQLTATDFSPKMLVRAEKKYGRLANIRFETADILHLNYPDGIFDAVVAANVIYLLDAPETALAELRRVCRNGGKIIIPTYMNRNASGDVGGVSRAIDRFGANFRHKFTPEAYRHFLETAGYADVRYTLCEGRIPCMMALIYNQA